MSYYYIGLISGTSMDAVDAAIVDFNSPQPKLVAYHAEPIPELLKQKTRLLCVPGENEINRLGEADVEWGQLFALATQTLLQQAGLSSTDIIAIGSHGQTIRHSPTSKHPFTLQIGDPNNIAALTGITTVADFRRMDMACGGHGAPLAPAFHRHLFQQAQQDTLVVNVGGIANITYLPADKTQKVIGFDTGPGNTLMDAWCQLHLKLPFDENGAWAMQGNINQDLLARLLDDPYFSQPSPKSTGPEYFHLNWMNSEISAVDTQRTLLELTAQTLTNAILPLVSSKFSEVLLCGGGARNGALLQRIQSLLGQNFSVLTTDHYGAPADWLEAMLFAWLAKMRLEEKPLDLSNITGSHKSVLLGGIY
jgi:anhydro-N-acetylmuramic acid kinase